MQRCFGHVCVHALWLCMMYLALLRKLKQLSQFRLFDEFVVFKSSRTCTHEDVCIGDGLNYVLAIFSCVFEFLILLSKD